MTPGERQSTGGLHLSDLVASQLSEVAIDQQRRQHHDDEAGGRDPWRHDEEQQQQQAAEERQRREPDATSQMGVEVGPPDLLHEPRVLFRESLLDLFEDPLFVLAEGASRLPAWVGKDVRSIIGVGRCNRGLSARSLQFRRSRSIREAGRAAPRPNRRSMRSSARSTSPQRSPRSIASCSAPEGAKPCACTPSSRIRRRWPGSAP